jgi:hypothetical protein
MAVRATTDHASEGPASLHKTMQAAIVRELHGHYSVQKHIPHSLFVLLMQMNDKAPFAKPTRRSPSKPWSTPIAKQANKLPSSDQSPELLSEVPI